MAAADIDSLPVRGCMRACFDERLQALSLIRKWEGSYPAKVEHSAKLWVLLITVQLSYYHVQA